MSSGGLRAERLDLLQSTCSAASLSCAGDTAKALWHGADILVGGWSGDACREGEGSRRRAEQGVMLVSTVSEGFPDKTELGRGLERREGGRNEDVWGQSLPHSAKQVASAKALRHTSKCLVHFCRPSRRPVRWRGASERKQLSQKGRGWGFCRLRWGFGFSTERGGNLITGRSHTYLKICPGFE